MKTADPTYRNLFSMGTRLDMVFPDCTEATADAFTCEISDVLDTLENKISIYRENSVFSRLNRQASSHACKTDPDTMALIRQLIYLSEKTLGYFDFSIGKMAEGDYEPVTQRFFFDSVEQTIAFTSDRTTLDSGGFGKGLGLDIIGKRLKKHGLLSAFISFGESSILAYGNHPFGKGWKTGIRNLFDEGESVIVFDLHNEVLSVSGVSRENLKKYGSGHVINPHNGKPVDRFCQAAVAGRSGLISEAISTALLCAAAEDRHAIMEGFPDYRALCIEYDSKNQPITTFSYQIEHE